MLHPYYFCLLWFVQFTQWCIWWCVFTSTELYPAISPYINRFLDICGSLYIKYPSLVAKQVFVIIIMTPPSIKLNSGIWLWLSIFFFLLKFGMGGNLITKWDLISKFGDFLIAQLVKNLPAIQETPVWFLGQKIHWRGDRLPTPGFLGFPFGSAG